MCVYTSIHITYSIYLYIYTQTHTHTHTHTHTYRHTYTHTQWDGSHSGPASAWACRRISLCLSLQGARRGTLHLLCLHLSVRAALRHHRVVYVHRDTHMLSLNHPTTCCWSPVNGSRSSAHALTCLHVCIYIYVYTRTQTHTYIHTYNIHIQVACAALLPYDCCYA